MKNILVKWSRLVLTHVKKPFITLSHLFEQVANTTVNCTKIIRGCKKIYRTGH